MRSPPYIHIELNPAYKLVLSQWLRAVDSAEYRSSLQQSYDAIKLNSVVGWLVDLTRLTSPNIRDQKWTAELLGKQIPETRLRKIALVLPDDLFLEVVIEKIGEQILQMTNYQIQIAYFNTYDCAYQWLLSLKDKEGLFREDASKDHENEVNSQ